MMANHTIDRIFIIDQDLFNNKQFISSLNENFNITVELLLDYDPSIADAQDVLYISNTFDSPLFHKLASRKKPIISDLIVEHCIQERTALPLPKYPLYNYFMKEFIICFSIGDKRNTGTINRYLNLIRYMGGQSRRDMKSGKLFERTHLVESRTDSINYRLAFLYGIPIIYKEWIDFIWQNRRDSEFVPSDVAHLEPFRIKPLVDLRICLYNFTEEEVKQCSPKISEFNGTVVDLYNPSCTHLVVKNPAEANYIDIVENFREPPKFIVSESWLNSSLELKNREDEELHKLKLPLFDTTSLNNTPLKEDSISHHTLNSLLLSPNYDNSIDDSATVDKTDLKKQAITQELYQTEVNYVTILKDIIKLFRDPLKNHELPGELPNEIELKTIFGGLPPIIEVHEKILTELEVVVKNWKAENEIGKIFQKHSQDFLTVYPQYVNYYEKTKEMIDLCIEKYSKFYSFLKATQTLPECKKQTFQELLINPIQRLPRIEMYLRALLNKTDKLHPDYKLLNEALNTVVSVITEINYEKKKTEGQIEMFDILNDIEDCPATLLSAKRQLVSKCDAKLLIQNQSDGINSIHKLDNYIFCLLLFTDLIVLCKKRIVKRSNSLRDRTTTLSSTVTKKTKKTYKYIETIDLASIKYIYYDFEDSEMVPEYENAFVLIIVSHNEHRTFPTYPFLIKDLHVKKEDFINDIVSSIENATAKEVDSSVLKKGYFKNLDFSHTKIIIRMVNKSKFVLMRTKERLNRTFSMRKTSTQGISMSMENLSNTIGPSPSSLRISRVFTNLFTNPKDSDSGDIYSHNTRRQNGSISDINEMSISSSDAADNFSLPSTPAPRKKKHQAPDS